MTIKIDYGAPTYTQPDLQLNHVVTDWLAHLFVTLVCYSPIIYLNCQFWFLVICFASTYQPFKHYELPPPPLKPW